MGKTFTTVRLTNDVKASMKEIPVNKTGYLDDLGGNNKNGEIVSIDTINQKREEKDLSPITALDQEILFDHIEPNITAKIEQANGESVHEKIYFDSTMSFEPEKITSRVTPLAELKMQRDVATELVRKIADSPDLYDAIEQDIEDLKTVVAYLRQRLGQ